MASVSDEGGLIKVSFGPDDWYKGLIPTHGVSDSGYREGDGLSWSLAVNPWRELGYLAPGFQNDDVTNMGDITNNATIKNITVAAGDAYAIEDATLLHQLDELTGEVTNTGSWPHTITPHGHLAATGSDVITYSIGGIEYVFYSWNDDTDGDVGRLTPSGPTFDDDYMSTVPTGAAVLNKDYPHPMIVGAGDILYIANGAEIVAYDGPNDTAATLAFKVPDGFIITSFARSANFLVVFCSTKTTYDASPGQSQAFFWDYASEDATYKYDLNCAYVNGGFSFKGSVGVFGQRQSFSSNRSLLMMFDGGSFETVASTRERIPGHGGVGIMDEMIIWNAGDFGGLGTSRVYSYGKIAKGFDNALNQIGTGGGNEAEGVLFPTGSSFNTGILASTGGSSGELNRFYQSFQTSALAYSGLKNIDFGRYGQGKVVDVKVVYRDTVTDGQAFTLKLNTDSQGTTTNTRGTFTTLVNGDTSLDTLIKHYETDSSGAEFPQFSNSIGFTCSWSGSNDTETHMIRNIDIYIEPVSTSS